MRVKKLTDGSVLEPGQLLVVLHCLNQCCSDAREQRMSGGLSTATRRQKKSSYLTASPSNSGKNENRLPNAHDDVSLRYQRSWKEHRAAQRKTGGCINRRD